MNQRVRVCDYLIQTRAIVSQVPEDGSVSLTMWYTDPLKFYQSTCNVWCLNQHNKPDPLYKQSPLQKLFVDVVINA